MTFHTISKRSSKHLAYTLLIALWITLEYWYTQGDISWPWLLLGNGFSSDIWAIQWYEYTGLFGGSLWVLLSNIMIYEALRARSRKIAIWAGAVVAVPLMISAVMYITYEEPTERAVKVTVVQPNIHFGRKDHPNDEQQRENLFDLAAQAPEDVDFVVMPECAIPDLVNVTSADRSGVVRKFSSIMAENYTDAALISGVSTIKYYEDASQSPTVRQRGDSYYDIFNSAIYISQSERAKFHHKAKLVIGTEAVPFSSILKKFDKLIIDLGGSLGQLGRGSERIVFHDKAAAVGSAICYEALYGAYYGEFITNGAEVMFVISNDCWWDNTPGYKHLFSMSAIRAVEHRRAIARSANTGISGFISPRGDSLETLGWDQRGVLTAELPLNRKITFYSRHGDYIARIAILMAILSLLNYMVFRVRQRNHLV